MFVDSISLIATTTASTVPDVSSWANYGTIAAGFAAAIALGIDAWTRLFGKQPRYVLSIKTSTIKGKEFCLKLINFGDASGEILSIEADPDWKHLGVECSVTPLLPFMSFTADTTDSLTIPLSTESIRTLLQNYYAKEENYSNPLILHMCIKYKSHALCPPFREEKKAKFKINLLSVYLDVFPLQDIISKDKCESFLSIYLSQLEEVSPATCPSCDGRKKTS